MASVVKQPSRNGRSFVIILEYGSNSRAFPIASHKLKKQVKADILWKVYDSALGIVTKSCTTEPNNESLMTMILVVLDESSRKSEAMGSRRCKEALVNGWRCEGNLFGALGFGDGVRKGGILRSWKWMSETEFGSQPWTRSMA